MADTHASDGHRAHHHHGFKARVMGWFRPHSHDLGDLIDPALERSSEGIRATKLALAALALTSGVQIVIALVSGSVALLADTVHNVADGLTSVPLWIAFAVGRRARTRAYTYGFRRAEDLAAVFIVVVIALSAVLIGWQSVDRLLHPEPLTHLGWVFLAGLVGVGGNELAAVVRIRTGRRIGSAALVADGFHARADTMASVGVLVAVAATWVGYPVVDPIVGLVICGLILWILKDTAVHVFRRLMDGVDAALVDRIEAATAAVADVEEVDWVRARWTGHRLHADLAIAVDADLTVLDAHAVAERVEHALLHHLPQLEHVHVHVHPSSSPGHDLHATTRHHHLDAPRAG